jgi:hypothetical protein
VEANTDGHAAAAVDNVVPDRDRVAGKDLAQRFMEKRVKRAEPAAPNARQLLLTYLRFRPDVNPVRANRVMGEAQNCPD